MPASTNYPPIIEGGLQVSESISLDGSPSMSYSNIEISNENGMRDYWLNYVWVNRAIKIYVGDLAWAKADFQLVFDGIIFDIDSSSRENLVLKIRDKLQRLNNPISTTEVKDIYPATLDTADYYHSFVPLTFGECFNIKPLLIDSVTLEYAVHQQYIEQIIEVRDNGIPLSASAYSVGIHGFTLLNNPSGEITASVQGDKVVTVYNNTIASLIKRIVKDYGNEASKLTDSDIDLVNFASFETAHTQPVGIFIADKVNLIEVIQQLAFSVGAVVTFGRDGKLRLLQIAAPENLPSQYDITDADMVESSLKLASRIEVKANARIGYCKNWTVQKGLVTSIPDHHKTYYANDNLKVTKYNIPTKNLYKIPYKLETRETLLLTSTDAKNEAQRECDLYSIARATYEFEAFAIGLQLSLGDVITIYSTRYGMTVGKKALVLKLKPDYEKFTVLVEVLI